MAVPSLKAVVSRKAAMFFPPGRFAGSVRGMVAPDTKMPAQDGHEKSHPKVAQLSDAGLFRSDGFDRFYGTLRVDHMLQLGNEQASPFKAIFPPLTLHNCCDHFIVEAFADHPGR